MKLVIQRVKKGSVTVNGEIVGKIEKGVVVLVGIHRDDKEDDLDWCIKKLLTFYYWDGINDEKPWRVGIPEIEAEILLVSQFTLYGRYGNGRRPDFSHAMSPKLAEPLFNLFVEKVKNSYNPLKVQTGIFGAMMDLELINDGPVTFIFDSFQRKD